MTHFLYFLAAGVARSSSKKQFYSASVGNFISFSRDSPLPWCTHVMDCLALALISIRISIA